RAQRFMAENEALLTGRRKAIAAVEDFAVGPAHPKRQGAHQNRAIRPRWFGDLLEPRRVGGAGRNGDCAHPCPWIASHSGRGGRSRHAARESSRRVLRRPGCGFSAKRPLHLFALSKKKIRPAATKIRPVAF